MYLCVIIKLKGIRSNFVFNCEFKNRMKDWTIYPFSSFYVIMWTANLAHPKGGKQAKNKYLETKLFKLVASKVYSQCFSSLLFRLSSSSGSCPILGCLRSEYI